MRYLAVITLLVLALAQPAAARTFSPDFIVGWDAYEEKDYATALKNLRPLAKQGVADAQFYLGMMYYEGKGVPQAYAMAFRWLRQVALEGPCLCAVRTWLDVQQWPRRLTGQYNGLTFGSTLPLRTAKKMVPEAQHNLGWHYYAGEGVSPLTTRRIHTS